MTDKRPDDLQKSLLEAHVHEDRPITEEELLAYHRGQLDSEASELFLDRLVSDPEAMAALEDLREMDPEGRASSGGEEAAAAWLDFEQRLASSPSAMAPEKNAAIIEIDKKKSHLQKPFVNWILIAACLGLAIWGISREAIIAEMRQQKANEDYEIVAVDLASPSRGAFQFDPTGDFLAIDIALSSADHHRDRYEVVLQISSGEVIDTKSPTFRNDKLVYTIEKEKLETSGLIIVCYSIHDGERKELGRFGITPTGLR